MYMTLKLQVAGLGRETERNLIICNKSVTYFMYYGANLSGLGGINK